jgi:hypothetical protein
VRIDWVKLEVHFQLDAWDLFRHWKTMGYNWVQFNISIWKSNSIECYSSVGWISADWEHRQDGPLKALIIMPSSGDDIKAGCDSRSRMGRLIPPDESIQFGFDHSPAASDSPGFDIAWLDIFKVSRAGNPEIIAGFLCAEYGAVIERDRICIGAPIIAVAPVGKLATVITPALF